MTQQQLKAILTATLVEGTMPVLIKSMKEGKDNKQEVIAGAAVIAQEIINHIYQSQQKEVD